MTSRKQKALFRKSLNMIFPPTILDNGEILETSLYDFRKNRKHLNLELILLKNNIIYLPE